MNNDNNTHTSAYSLRRVPKYESQFNDRDISSRSISGNFILQGKFWSAMLDHIVYQNRGSFSLRYLSLKDSHEIHIQLIIAASNEEKLCSLCVFFEALCPSEYVWNRDTKDSLSDIFFASDTPEKCSITRLRKKIKMLDLPIFENNLASLSSAPSNRSGTQSFCSEKAFPNLKFDLRDQIEDSLKFEKIWSFPYILPLRDVLQDRQRLFLDLQNSAPALICFTVHPATVSNFQSDALFLKIFADIVGRIMSISTTEMEYGLGLFQSPPGNLANISIYIAAQDHMTATNLSHSLVAHIGDTDGLDIVPAVHIQHNILLHAILSKNDRNADDLKARLDVQLSNHFADKNQLNHASYNEFLKTMTFLYQVNEMEILLRLPFATEAGLPGVQSIAPIPFYLPTIIKAATEEKTITLGEYQIENSQILSSGDGQHKIPVDNLTKHIMVCGSTGSGKTVATLNILRQLHKEGIKFLVIEPVKKEYYDRLKNDIPELIRFNFEEQKTLLPFDPLRLPSGVSVARHVSYLKSCFEAAFPISAVQSMILENGLRAYYAKPKGLMGKNNSRPTCCGFNLFDKGGRYKHNFVDSKGSIVEPQNVHSKKCHIRPSFESFIEFFIDHFLPAEFALSNGKGQAGRNSNANLGAEWAEMFMRRFNNLWESSLGEAFRMADLYARVPTTRPLGYYNYFDNLLQYPCIIELEALTDAEHKSLIMSFLLVFLYERRQVEAASGNASGLKHLLVVEEAHRLLSKPQRGRSDDLAGSSAQSKAVSMFCDMLAEIRAYGQGLMIVEQIPSKLAPEAAKNTALKLMLRMPSPEDRHYLGDAMGMTPEQKNFALSLEPGQTIVHDERYESPVLIRVPFSGNQV
ncbi:type IV secretion system DNA-binding domain-containing protein [Desulfosarcina sp. OttesenSCG-928-G10]|nr:type IV secretion system DNA-binding domain-containing protein [Desulfosarcina sp. OttesenSCG-928-G10]